MLCAPITPIALFLSQVLPLALDLQEAMESSRQKNIREALAHSPRLFHRARDLRARIVGNAHCLDAWRENSVQIGDDRYLDLVL